MGDSVIGDSPAGFCGVRESSRLCLPLCFASPLKKMSRKQKVFELCDKVQRDLKLAGLPRDGCATDGTDYSSILAMWSSELGYGPPAVGARFLVHVFA